MTAIDPASAPHPRQIRDALSLWSGVLGPPLLWLVHLQVGYMVVPLACHQHQPLIVHGVTVTAIVLVLGLSMLNVVHWRRSGREWPDSSASVISQDRFLAVTGLAISALIIAALIAQWMPSFFLDPCR